VDFVSPPSRQLRIGVSGLAVAVAKRRIWFLEGKTNREDEVEEDWKLFLLRGLNQCFVFLIMS
jgi:hypothetical protein